MNGCASGVSRSPRAIEAGRLGGGAHPVCQAHLVLENLGSGRPDGVLAWAVLEGPAGAWHGTRAPGMHAKPGD